MIKLKLEFLLIDGPFYFIYISPIYLNMGCFHSPNEKTIEKPLEESIFFMLIIIQEILLWTC